MTERYPFSYIPPRHKKVLRLAIGRMPDNLVLIVGTNRLITESLRGNSSDGYAFRTVLDQIQDHCDIAICSGPDVINGIRRKFRRARR